MKGLALCNKGIEDVAALEIKEIIGKESQIEEGIVIFSLEKEEELCTLAYLGQSIEKVILQVGDFEFISKEDLMKKISSLDFSHWLNEKRSFKADANVEENSLDTEELKQEIGEAIIKNISSYKQKVNLKRPDIIVYAVVKKNHAYVGIDFSGIELSKRSYRIFSSPRNIKSTIAYAAVRLSDFKRGEILLDPFCISGSIPIETALHENHFPVRFFDKEFAFMRFMEFDFSSLDKKMSKDKGTIHALDSQFKNVDSAKKNAKIAGIHKAINFSRLEIEWLDTKFEKDSVDRIVTCLPSIGKFSNEGDVLKIYKEFFYQAEFVLRKKGKIVVCCRNPDKVKEKSLEYKFKLDEQREVWQGEEKFFMMKFSK